MNENEKLRLRIVWTIGVILVVIAFYVGHVADACSDGPWEISVRVGIPLFLLFCGLLYSVKVGKTSKAKVLRAILKTMFNFVFAVGLLALSFNLCF